MYEKNQHTTLLKQKMTVSSQWYKKCMTSAFDGKQQLVIMEQGEEQMACRKAGTSKVLGEEMPILKTPRPKAGRSRGRGASQKWVCDLLQILILHWSDRGQTEVKQRSNRGQALYEERQRTNGQSVHKYTYNIVLTGFFL